MNNAILLVSTATQYIGTARIPAALTHAGFEVSLLTPRNSLAEKSRFVRRCDFIPDDASPMDWLAAFQQSVAAVSPRLVLPCDDNSVRLLQALILAPPVALPVAARFALGSLVRESLGDPKHYVTSVDKVLLAPAAEALGVRVPPHRVVTTLEDAQKFAATHGYPVVLKLGHGAGGRWVRIVPDRGALGLAFAELLAASLPLLGEATARQVLVQKHIEGSIVLQSLVAWKGEVLGGYAREKLIAHPPPMGPSTVSRTFHCPEARLFAERLAVGFGMNAFFGVEFIAERQTGELYLLEINRRITPGTHVGTLVDVDLCAALHAALNGCAPAGRNDLAEGEEHVLAHFPQEWLRDPLSRHLRECRLDLPWDDPQLFEAMLAMRHEEWEV
ncbi:MAG: ATP-grasp domain-containing protein [Betaproteobacteria bacterium]|nr:ATP-grasp domain-containing protein [Betaproteobacteria bacterium]